MANARRSRPEPYKPPAEFGQQVIETCKAIGKTTDELVRAAGYESRKTLERLARGEGSLESALAIRDQLQAWGVDVSALPMLGVDGKSVEPREQWEREWMQLGRQLYKLASDERFEVEKQRLRDLIQAHELVAEGTGKRRT